VSFEHYKGYTHPHLPLFMLPVWKRFMCVKEMHLWDEVASSLAGNYFVCDACHISVGIYVIEEELE
jgi:hypothetical protein